MRKGGPYRFLGVHAPSLNSGTSYNGVRTAPLLVFDTKGIPATRRERIVPDGIQEKLNDVKPGDVVKHAGESGFYCVGTPSGADVFIVPLRRLENGKYVRLPSGEGRYARAADLLQDFTTATVEVLSGDNDPREDQGSD